MTLAIELCGIAILVLFTVIPIKEFTQILRKIRREDPRALPPSGENHR
jgi:hypothetical protein